MFSPFLLAEAADAAANPAAGPASSISMIIMIVVMLAVMYFFMIRPQKSRSARLMPCATP